MAIYLPAIKVLLTFLQLFLIGTFYTLGFTQVGSQVMKNRLEAVEYFEGHLMPDSILRITEEVFHSGLEKDTIYYLEILEKGIQNAIIIRHNEIIEDYLIELVKSEPFQNDAIRRGNLYLNIASALTSLHQYAASTHYCKLAFECYEHSKRPQGTTSVLLLMYDNAYFSQEDSTNSLYLEQALEIARKSKDSSLLADVYFSTGKAWFRSGNQGKAIANYKIARGYVKPEDLDKQMNICIYQHLSYTYCDSVDLACNLSEFILATTRAKGMEPFYSNAYLGRAYCYAQTGFTDSAKYYLDLSHEWRLKTPKATASPGYYEQLYKVSMMIPDYDRALKYLEIKAEQENQINKRNNAAVLADSRAEFDYLLQKARIGELKAQNSISEEKAKRRKTTVLGIGAILLISIVSFLNMRTQYKSLGHSYETLVKKHIEVDQLNQQLIAGNGKRSNKRAGVFIKDEDNILLALRKLLKEDKIYKMSDLSLSMLAEELGTNTSYLSTIINSHYRVNLKTLVNTCRIDEARKILVSKEGENYSIEGIAQEVGFQSRSVFYQTFKQITGLTPSAYVKIYKSACPDS